MFCTQCGSTLGDRDRFCPQCGLATGVDAPRVERTRLTRDIQNKKIAGVCAGFAKYLDADVVLVRVIWLAAALCTGGVGFLAYLAAWIIMPKETAGAAPAAEFAGEGAR
jgi:phage shock protein C